MSDQTPADAARTEAARQAVMFVFAMAGGILLVFAQKRIMRDHPVVIEADPMGYREAKMKRAKKAEQRWSKVVTWAWPVCYPVAKWAGRQADHARKMYEAELP